MEAEPVLDPKVQAALAAQGITTLYPPQVEAWRRIVAGRSLVVAVPTAAGKSLVAYLAILHRHMTRPHPGKALYIVPLRALAWEKVEELRAFAALGLRVGLATGDPDEEDKRLGRFDVVVATSEKADSLLRHRTPWLSQVDLVVADEVHLLNDAGRGPTLEVLLARLRAQRPGLTVVALSATIDNADELARWLGADLVESTWRPVDLRRGIHHETEIHFEDGTTRRLTVADDDAVTALVLDIVEEGGQALVFVNTRRSTEAVARRVAPHVARRLDDAGRAVLRDLAKDLARGGEATRSGQRLAEVVDQGAAFHNAGLDARQRRRVEHAFRAGHVKCLVATPTLAAGVNTPARRVVVRDVWRYEANLGNRPLPVLEVMQMMGRAGRPRYDTYGEAVLIAKKEEDVDTLRQTYLDADPEPIRSKLGAEPALRTHLLATVASGFAATDAEVDAFLDSTFYAHQGEGWLIKDQTRHVLTFLQDHGFLARRGDALEATAFGKRTSDLYIDPLSALTLRTALERAAQRPGPVPLFAYLHAIAATNDANALYLGSRDTWVAAKAEEHEEDLLLTVGDAATPEEFLSTVKTAALLEDWVEERPVDTLEARYNVGPGDVRDRVDRSRWLAHALRELGRVLAVPLDGAVKDLPLRLEAGVKAELLPLIRLDGVGRVRARRLHNAGYKSLAKLRAARVQELERVDTIGPKVARRILAQVTAGGKDALPGASERTLEAF